ncbi:MAG: arsenite efflux transporter metallochaperone ArsD [Planctomycetota bacterium]|jgi:hypothetical protein
MKTLKIYDPAMCCSTGVCGPNVNESLVQLAAFLKGVDESAVAVERYNLTQEPNAYVENGDVAAILKEKGVEVLPLFYVDGELRFSGDYPSVEQLAEALSVECGPASSESCCCSEGCC